MYLDITLRKVSFLLGISLLLTLLVYSTNVAKVSYFGTTPFFYTVTVGGKYLIDSAISTVRASAVFTTSMFARNDTLTRAPAIPVLTYHRIVQDSDDLSNVSVKVFYDQMSALKKAGWNTISLKDFEAYMHGDIVLPERSFFITFDDGAKESFYPADPILNAMGYQAAMFVIVESSKTPESTYYLSPQELSWIMGTGRWSIGSHSTDGHRSYAADSEGTQGVFFADKLWIQKEQRIETDEEFSTRVTNDLADAKRELEKTYAVPINTFAFPLGNETGIEGAANYPEGASITEAKAREIYDFGFLQLNNQQFTFNVPEFTPSGTSTSITTETQRLLGTDFVVRRIHVDHDWDGKRLLAMMENGLSKPLPYEDDFTFNNGWILAWGTFDIGRNNFVLKAVPEQTSASVFLDGTALWDDYMFDASFNWDNGDIFMLADLTQSKTYDACVFSPGMVRIQSTINGETRTLKEIPNPSIAYGENVRMGIRVHGSIIECTWNFASIGETYDRTHSGGVGIQIWNPQAGAATLQVSSLIVRPYTSESSASLPVSP